MKWCPDLVKLPLYHVLKLRGTGTEVCLDFTCRTLCVDRTQSPECERLSHSREVTVHEVTTREVPTREVTTHETTTHDNTTHETTTDGASHTEAKPGAKQIEDVSEDGSGNLK